MRKYLLPEKGNNYKANLHCHSTISDGRLTVEQLKKVYLERGYSIIAYTDHNRLVDHSDLSDENFLALNGYELDVSAGGLTAHMCFVAKTPDNLNEICPREEREYSHDGVNKMFKAGVDSGFFVTYNHPSWSMESYPQYSGYKGMHAMEIFNTGCVYAGYTDYNDHQYDDLLRLGNRIYCVAADDNHNGADINSPHFDSFGGWVTIRSDKLEYTAITSALEKGDFYASCGPEIYDFYIEDDTVHITTSPAHSINYITGIRHCAAARAFYGDNVTEASFKINPADNYFRIDVVDDHGNHANTNAVFIDTL